MSHQKLANPFAVVSLKHDLTILSCTTTRTETFEFFGHTRQVRGLLVYTVHYSRWFAEFSCFKSYPDSLLLFFYLNTSAQVFGQAACWTNLSHDAQCTINAAVYKIFKSKSRSESHARYVGSARDIR